MKTLFFIIALFSVQFLSAATINLVNDTGYDLTARILGADGVKLGEIVIKSQYTYAWTDTFEVPGYGQRTPDQQKYHSQQPYTVEWYCMNGKRRSYCLRVQHGATVRAKECTFEQRCATKKPGYTPNPPPEGQELYTPPKVPSAEQPHP
jgi:hypothetical protein